jgi:hypothetical protein
MESKHLENRDIDGRMLNLLKISCKDVKQLKTVSNGVLSTAELGAFMYG